ncbi:MAG: hypothetical protein A2145_02715 [candidate division Zixibacteria bacterium RBG_16_40_9]|nr:MAG: hypothetical protein A2145_02715 [candidate division Zixibacteria bacterium RBG_16_40_9]
MLELDKNPRKLFFLEDEINETEIHYAGTKEGPLLSHEVFIASRFSKGKKIDRLPILFSEQSLSYGNEKFGNLSGKDFLSKQGKKGIGFYIYALRACNSLSLQDPDGDRHVLITSDALPNLVGKDYKLEESDNLLLPLLYRFFKTNPSEVLLPEDIFISSDFTIENIKTRLKFFSAMDILKFIPDMYGLDRQKIHSSQEFRRIPNLFGSDNAIAYSLAPGGLNKLEEMLESTLFRPNKYFQIVGIPEIEGKKFAFVLMPFKEEDFPQRVYKEVIKPLIESQLKILCIRSDEITAPGRINNQIYTGIFRADIVIAEMTKENLNVAIEVGIALALDKPVYILTQREPPKLFFDIRDLRMIQYENDEGLIEKLKIYLKPRI